LKLVDSILRKGPEPEYFVCKLHNARMVKVNNVLRCPICGSNRLKEEEQDSLKMIEGAI
jgi:Zn finger protein HypA/HybF involved in hydrogenase expression